MRCLFFVTVLLPLLGCPENTGDKVGNLDSGDLVCDRIDGASGIVKYAYDDGGTSESEDDAWSVNFPNSAPDGLTRTTGVSGPLSDGETWAALFGGRWLLSTDEGCTWDDKGGVLPSTGDWQLDAQGTTVYAWDRASSAGAFSKSDGASWTATDASEPFVAFPVADPGVAGKLRGVQARGVVTSDDDGTNWDVSAASPAGTLTGAAVWPGGIDTIVAATSEGVFLSRSGGGGWDEIGVALETAGIVPSGVAIHPSDADTIWVIGTDTNGPVIEITTDAGLNWSLVVAQRNVDLDVTAALWPDPTEADVLLSHFDSGDGDGSITMYRFFAGNIESHKVSSYRGISDIGFLPDGSWLAGVDSVP